jgi:hypothetical protein
MPLATRFGNDRPREDRVQRAAQEAWDKGERVFVATIPFTGGTAIRKGMGHPLVGKEIEAILRMGWRLDTWEVISGEWGATAVPLFVRPDAFSPIR